LFLYTFSENPEQAAVLLAQLMQGQTCTVLHNNLGDGANAEAEFWLMRQCRHFIIGNSTFACWSEWLAEQDKSGKLVFAPFRNVDPLHSVTAWGFSGLLPDRWTAL